MSDADFATLASEMDRIFAPSRHVSISAFRADPLALGPTLVECGSLKRPAALRRTYGAWPQGGARAAVPLRSVSKTFAAVAILALVERRAELGHSLSLETKAGEFLGNDVSALCAGGAGGAGGAVDWRDSTLFELLTMSARSFDNGINSAWRNLSHAADHNGLPTPCDSPDTPRELRSVLDDNEACLTNLLLPAYDRAPHCAGLGLRTAASHAAARALALSLVDGVSVARDTTCADQSEQCCAWAKIGEVRRARAARAGQPSPGTRALDLAA